MDKKSIARIKNRLATPPPPRIRKGTAAEFANEFRPDIEAARRNGKSWQQIIDDCADEATFTTDALRQAHANLAKPTSNKRQRAVRSNPSISLPAGMAERAKTRGDAQAHEDQRNLFATAFGSRMDTLSDVEG